MHLRLCLLVTWLLFFLAAFLKSTSSWKHGQSTHFCLWPLLGIITATRADRTGAQERTWLKARGAVLKGRLHTQCTTVSQLEDQYRMVERVWVPCAHLLYKGRREGGQALRQVFTSFFPPWPTPRNQPKRDSLLWTSSAEDHRSPD